MNKWKRLFFILLAINFILAAGFVALVLLPGEQAQVKDASESEYGFQVTSTKESLAAFVNSYLNDKASNKLALLQKRSRKKSKKSSVCIFYRSLATILMAEDLMKPFIRLQLR